MTDDSYRSRVYGQYVQVSAGTLAPPPTLAGLAPRAPYLRRLVREHFPADREAAVLDVGCGHGALIHFAREAGYHNLRGVDCSSEQVEAARRLGIESVEEGDLRRVLYAQADASLNVVVAFDVFEHLTRDELLPCVDQVHRVLKAGGGLIIHVPNGASPFFGAIRYGDLTHELAFTCMSLSQLLLSSGFSSVRCFEDAPVVHSVKSALRWVLWKGFCGVLRFYIAAETGTSDTGGAHIFSQNMLMVATK